MSESPRRDPRVASMRGLLVRCESWAEFVQHYATDISQGGMFIVTDEPPELLSEIQVQVSLPEGHDVQMRAQVVHIIDQAQAERDGRPAGIGVQFLELDAVRRTQIRQLVEFARWEGATGRPAASLASRMFETATSLPPGRLIGALPAAPGAGTSSPATSRATKASPSNTPAKASPLNTPAKASPSNTPPKALPSSAPADKSVPTTERPRPGTSAPPSSAEAPAAEAAAPSASQTPSARATGKPLDTDRLKIGMTHLAHRRFMEAIALFSELSNESPQDPQPVLWRALSRARLELKDNDEAGAAEHYAQVLTIDENNHEARKFVREHGHQKRLEKLPFGRWFAKKK